MINILWNGLKTKASWYFPPFSEQYSLFNLRQSITLPSSDWKEAKQIMLDSERLQYVWIKMCVLC